MIQGINIKLNLDPYRGQMDQEIEKIMVSLRTVLRSLEDQSYQEKGNQPRPGGVITFQSEGSKHSEQEWASAEILKAYHSVIRALIDFIDKMIAISQVTLDKTSIAVDRSFKDQTELIDYVSSKANQIIENAVQKVAADRRLSNPKKIEAFVGLSDFSKAGTVSAKDKNNQPG